MNNLNKIENTLNKVNRELSEQLLFYDKFVNIANYRVKIASNKRYDEKDVDCCKNIIYIDDSNIDSISLKQILKHKLLHIYLYNITEIDFKNLSIDTSYLFIIYCLATDTKTGYEGENTIYYKYAVEIENLIKNKPYLIDLFYAKCIKKDTEILNSLNKLAETEWFRVNKYDYLINNKSNMLNIIGSVNNSINLIYELNNLEYNIFLNRLKKENA